MKRRAASELPVFSKDNSSVVFPIASSLFVTQGEFFRNIRSLVGSQPDSPPSSQYQAAAGVFSL